jgi:hypothetical protein
LASEQISGIPGSAKPVAWEGLRPRLYKAIRATVMARETADARRNLLERWLSTLFQEDSRKVTFPEELAEAQQAFFQASLEQAVNRCRRYAGAWFAWDPLDREKLSREVKKAVSQVAQADENAQFLLKGEVLKAEDLVGLLRYRLRQRWCGPAEAPETFQVEAWLQEVGFFSRELMEIGSWARLFSRPRTTGSMTGNQSGTRSIMNNPWSLSRSWSFIWKSRSRPQTLRLRRTGWIHLWMSDSSRAKTPRTFAGYYGKP